MLFGICSVLSKTLCVDGNKEFCGQRARKKYIAELMFSLYCLPSLCGTLNQIVWVPELGGLYKFIEGNSREVEKKELEVILKRLFLPEAQRHAV